MTWSSKLTNQIIQMISITSPIRTITRKSVNKSTLFQYHLFNITCSLSLFFFQKNITFSKYHFFQNITFFKISLFSKYHFFQNTTFSKYFLIFHVPMMTSRTRGTSTTTGLALWSHPGDLITPVGPSRTSTVHGCLVRQGGRGWHDSTTDDKRQNETTAQNQDDSNTGVGRDKL